MIHLDPDRYLTVSLISKERKALLEHTTAVDSSILENIRYSSSISLTEFEMEPFLTALEYEIQRAPTPKRAKILRRLRERLAALSNFRPAPTDSVGLASSLPEDMLAGWQFDSLADLNRHLRNQMDAHNRRPDPEMGGLSPSQVSLLIHSDWDDPDEALRFNDYLSPSDVAGSRFYQNVRVFLESLLNEEESTATAKGNLNRRFVRLMTEKMQWPAGDLEELQSVCKVLNEQDVFALHIVRVICACASLIVRWKTKFLVTKKAKDLLAEGKAGQLFTLLFKTYMRKFNLAYLDRLPPCHCLQATIAYSLYRLAALTSEWRSIDSLVPNILLPKVRQDITKELPSLVEPEWLIRARIIRPLEDFGLLECAYQDRDIPLIRMPNKVKKTDLFDKFLAFSLDA